MVEERAGGDFGDRTATFLGRLRKRKGVLLSVCTWHYGEITDSTYSSYEDVKFAHGHKIDILPLRMCDDPWPPEPPSGPDHPHDNEGTAEGLMAMAFHKSRIYVDCRGKDAHYITAKIAETLCPTPGEGAGLLPSPRTAGSRKPRVRILAPRHRPWRVPSALHCGKPRTLQIPLRMQQPQRTQMKKRRNAS